MSVLFGKVWPHLIQTLAAQLHGIVQQVDQKRLIWQRSTDTNAIIPKPLLGGRRVHTRPEPGFAISFVDPD